MIHVENLTKRYGERVLLDDVSWHVKKNDRINAFLRQGTHDQAPFDETLKQLAELAKT